MAKIQNLKQAMKFGQGSRMRYKIRGGKRDINIITSYNNSSYATTYGIKMASK